jgi:hypothetical protein
MAVIIGAIMNGLNEMDVTMYLSLEENEVSAHTVNALH